MHEEEEEEVEEEDDEYHENVPRFLLFSFNALWSIWRFQNVHFGRQYRGTLVDQKDICAQALSIPNTKLNALHSNTIYTTLQQKHTNQKH